ncbi:MAG TPA: site-specific integrase [Pyrinomonadaceae bacterium]|jgi:integrase
MPVENRGTAKRPRWRYAFTIRGVRYRASIPEARTKFEAEQAEIAAKRAVFDGTYGRPAGERDFVDFVERVYKPWARDNKRSWKNEEYCLPTITEWFRGKTFAQVSPLLIEKFKKHLRESDTNRGTKFSPRYVNYFLESLFRIFSLAVEHKEIGFDDNPCRKIKKLRLDNRRVRYLLDEEEPRLLAQCEGAQAYLRPLVLVAIGTGMRRGDMLTLKKQSLDFQRGDILVPNSKTGKVYRVPMTAEVREIMLQLVRQNQGSEFVFVNPQTGKPYVEIKKGFAEVCTRAGITNLHWHDLRHTFGTRMAEAGHSEATISELMGHSDPKTTRRYTHGTEAAKRAAVEATRPRTAAKTEQAAKLAVVRK